MNEIDLKADGVRWDLNFLYSGPTDRQIDTDVATHVAQMRDFNAKYKGHVAEKLVLAIADYIEMSQTGDKVNIYLFLRQSLDVADPVVKAKIADVDRQLSHASGEYMTFFELELVALEDATLEKLYVSEEIVRRHKPWIEHTRIFKPHVLSESVESALTKRSSFGPGAWAEFFDECEADLRFPWQGGEKTLAEMLDIYANSSDAPLRADALRTIDAGLHGSFAKYSAQTLYMIAGRSAVERKERGYAHPMAGRNKSNQVTDDVVDALHKAVIDIGGPLMRRYYKLKAEMLGMPTLAWSDRNAPLPFDDAARVPFDAAMETVLAAYESFSPTLAGLIRTMIAEKRIDAPATKGKRGGAYNYSFVLSDGKPATFTFLNYLGSNNDVRTLAHELGHGVHGMLAGEAQGTLMSDVPMAYAETASVFGEMITFNFLKAKVAASGDTKALISLITSKIEEILNTCVRQIGFSNFERQLHGMDESYSSWGEVTKRSVEELDALWLRTLQELYGADGEVFTYESVRHLWAYVGHFHSPFYVYAYGFGELLTQSLYAKRDALGAEFEPLYLDLLRAGSTKDVMGLTEPFGLDPSHESFWADGIRGSLGVMIDEVERLYRSLP